MISHEEKVQRIIDHLKGRNHTSPIILEKKTVSHLVPKAKEKSHPEEKLYIGDLDEILLIDKENRIGIAEPGVTLPN